MENNSQSRTLYLIQIVTIVILILVLIVQILPFFGLGITPKTLPPGVNPKGGSGYTSPAGGQAGAAQTSLVIPPLVLH